MAKMDVEIQIPRPPNFLRLAKVDAMVPIEEVDDEELQRIGEEWTRRLIEHARQRRNRV